MNINELLLEADNGLLRIRKPWFLHVMNVMNVIVSCWAHQLSTGSGWEYLFLMVRNMGGYYLGMTLTPAAWPAWNHIWTIGQWPLLPTFTNWQTLSLEAISTHHLLPSHQTQWMDELFVHNYHIRPVHLLAELPKRESYLKCPNCPSSKSRQFLLWKSSQEWPIDQVWRQKNNKFPQSGLAIELRFHHIWIIYTDTFNKFLVLMTSHPPSDVANVIPVHRLPKECRARAATAVQHGRKKPLGHGQLSSETFTSAWPWWQWCLPPKT